MEGKHIMQYPSWKENGKIKLMIIVGTRPEIIRLAAVIKKCRKYFDTILVHTGQNYDYVNFQRKVPSMSNSSIVR